MRLVEPLDITTRLALTFPTILHVRRTVAPCRSIARTSLDLMITQAVERYSDCPKQKRGIACFVKIMSWRPRIVCFRQRMR